MTKSAGLQRICHVTSAHNSHDDRIFLKECRSLAAYGYDVSLVAYGSTEECDEVSIVGLGERPSGRLKRMTQGAKKAIEAAEQTHADLFHLHDPELLPYARRLRCTGAKVVFDSHEDVPAQIVGKTWIPKLLRGVASRGFGYYEEYVTRGIDAVVAATPFIAESFQGKCPVVVTVNNYPMLDDVAFHETSFENRDASVCYAGGISESRGEETMLQATRGTGIKLQLAGPREGGELPDSLLEEMAAEGVRYLGVLDRAGVNDLYGNSIAGLVLLLPTENYINSKPIKMFEYMAAGLPVIASNFPEWRAIIDENQCGVCVDPYDVSAVRRAISEICADREGSQVMGRNGRQAVVKKYNWASEAIELLSLYSRLFS